ncbi:MAG: glycosyltransferase [Acetobacterium sp.]|nr:glycosyltransferase [Acetobacterium sp.]
MEERLGDRLIKAGYLTEENLVEAIRIQNEKGGLIGDVLVQYGYITSSDLSNFIFENKFTKLGELLLEKKLITREQLELVIDFQKKYGGRFGNICISMGFVTNEQIEKVLKNSINRKGKIGEVLVEKSIISQAQMDEAIDMQNKSGGKIGDILVFLGYVDQETLYRELSIQFEIGRPGVESDYWKTKNLPYQLAKKYSAIVISEREDCFILAVNDRLKPSVINEIEVILGKPVEEVLVTDEEMKEYWEARFKNIEKHKSIFDLYDSQPGNSAIVTFSTGQLTSIICLVVLLVICMMLNWSNTLIVVNLLFQAIYAIMTVLKLYIVILGEKNNVQLKFSDEELTAIDEKELPIYTILIPVYKEKEVVAQLIRNISELDYPQYKLDVKILLEEDDKETIEVIRGMNLKNYFSVLIVPSSKPQTKPKACNYGLLQAKGDYVVIFDAEDRPEKDQLKKVYLSFKSLPEEYVCVQAKLNYFNSTQNVLTRLFTQEYSMWFENLLVGIMQLNVPIPLGGTSNHFKINFLKEVGGWDPFNVTEDADLGVRLFKFRYKTVVLDSRTWEEANSDIGNWIRQRSRWIKGYMQTWLVHMRHPLKLFKELGLKGFVGYQAMVLGTPLLPLINPVFWFLMIMWIFTKAGWIQNLFPGAFYYSAVILFLVGNFMFTYTNIIGMYSVIRDCVLKRRQEFSYSIIKYALFTPVYWILMSIAAYKALFQLVKNPFYWEKTHHGLDSVKEDNVAFE